MQRMPQLSRVTAIAFGLLHGVGTVTVEAAISAGERTTLQDLYAGTNGASWIRRDNWNGAAGTECTWFGVTCNGPGTSVVTIDLHANNLTGSLPPLAPLTNLVAFLVNDNQLTGPIPALVGLPSLGYFRASSNQLTGSIPALAGMTSLVDFEISFNQVADPFRPSRV